MAGDEYRALVCYSFSAKGHVGLHAHTGDEHQAGRWIHSREAQMRVHGA
jgi:hypothetical protein